MKVCANCGDEIYTKDGENLCEECENERKKAKRRAARKAKDEVMRSLGLVKVKGALGGTYWE